MTGGKETGDRAAFLATITRAVTRSTHDGHARPVTPLPVDGVPAVAYRDTPDFAQALAALGGVVRDLVDPVAFTAFVNDALDAGKTSDRVRVALTDEPECAAVAYALGGRDDVDLVAFTGGAEVATADIGFSGARAAVARTGSIVVDAGRAGGRTVSLLPPLHVAIVERGAIVAEPGDLWRGLAAPMPSNLVQITGPSRSADIELVITLGVHGPRALWVGLVN